MRQAWKVCCGLLVATMMGATAFAAPPDKTAPTVPTGLTASAASCSQINLSWNASTDSGTGVASYKIYRGSTLIKTVAASIRSTSITGLAELTSYTHTVSAVDGRGNESAKSAGATATTPACPCTYSISPTNASVAYSGDAGSVGVTAGTTCSWTASSSVAWVAITGGTSGTGNGAVSYSVAANASISSRSGTLTIAGMTYTVNQAGAPCSFSISSTSASYDENSAADSVTVTASDGSCNWTASSAVGWVTITAGASGTGNGTVSYSVAANTSMASRSGTLTIAGKTFTVNQAGIPCTYSISSTNVSVSASGATGSVSVTAGVGCAWTASSGVAWITITAGASGSGNGIVNYSVAANPNTVVRSGTVTIAGQTFTVNQAAAACTYSISSTNASIAYSGGNGSVNVTTATNCGWIASSGVAWVTITAGASGTGNGTVNYSVAANPNTTSRSGTLTIAGQTFTANQAAAPCTYSLSSTNVSVGSGSSAGSVNVTAASNCNWTASSSVSWVTITAGASGTGNGTVNYSVAANPNTTTRSGTMTIAGQTFTVNQAAAACTYSLSSTNASVASSGGTGSVNVTAGAGCNWTASSGAAWVTITGGTSGAGNGTVSYSVASNPNTTSRIGTVTIAGQTFTVNQSGVSCTYSISSTNASAAASGGNGSVNVTAGAGCNWTAGSGAAWISITAGASGSGNGTVNYSVGANPNTSSRSGTMTIAGQIFTVNQAGASCTYSISSTNVSFNDAANSASVNVTAPSGCGWSASSAVAWVTITGGASGNGNGVVSYSVDANTSTSSRTGTLTIAGQTYTVNQAGATPPPPTCNSSLSPTMVVAPANPYVDSVVVTSDPCPWTAVASDPWIKITAGSTGNGNGTVTYSLTANTSPDFRYGTITIASQVFYVYQYGGAAGPTCTYVITPASTSIAASGGTGSVDLTVDSSCDWTATSSVAWITITSGASGLGNGTVSYSVAANTVTTARSGTLTIGDQTFTVNQAAATTVCNYSLSQTNATIPAAGGNATVDAITGATCGWNASSSVPWITITSPTSGTGSGTMSYSVAANPNTAARSGSLMLADQTLVVNQDPKPCSYSLSAGSATIVAGGGNSSVNVNADGGCGWGASSSVAWITITSPASGSGNGTVTFSVEANPNTAPRSGTMTIAGQTFTINQDAKSCSYSISPGSVSLTSSSGSGTVNVTADAGCNWTASSSAAWITITVIVGGNGSGNGYISYSVASNGSSSARTGTLTVAGQTFTVTQSGTAADVTPPNSFFLSPASGSNLSGPAQLTVRVTDNVAVGTVQLYVDNLSQWIMIGQFTNAAATVTNGMSYNTTNLLNGSHTLMCLAYDTANNYSVATLSVTVSNVNLNPGNLLYANEIGRSQNTSSQLFGNAVKTDSQGNQIVVGKFTGTADFGAGAVNSVGGYNVFVAKYAANGNLIWARTYGGNADSVAQSVAIDSAGNILITGYFFGAIDFGGGLLSSGDGVWGSDIFVAKFTSNGDHIWSKRMGGQYGNNTGQAIAVDRNDEVFVTGRFYMEADLGTGQLVSKGGSDGYLVKFHGTDGSVVWEKDFGGENAEYSQAVAVDANGDAIVTGYSYGNMDFGGIVRTNSGSIDLFVAKFSGVNGQHVWSKMLGSTGSDTSETVTVDSSNNIVVSGAFIGNVDFGGVTLSAAYSSAIYIAKFSPSGSLLMARGFGGNDSTSTSGSGSRSVAVDSSDNIVVTGNATGGVDFGNGVTYGSGTMYIAKYSPTGTYLWANRYSCTGLIAGFGITTDQSRNVISTGFFSGTVNFGSFQLNSPGTQIRSVYLWRSSP